MLLAIPQTYDSTQPTISYYKLVIGLRDLPVKVVTSTFTPVIVPKMATPLVAIFKLLLATVEPVTLTLVVQVELLPYGLVEVVQPLATLVPLPSPAVHLHSVPVMLATTMATLILVLMAVMYSLNLDFPQATLILVATLC